MRSGSILEQLDNDLLLKAILANDAHSVIVTDKEGIIRYWNAGAEKIFKYTAEDITGHSIEKLYFTPDNDLKGDLERLKLGGDLKQWKGKTKHGAPVWIKIKTDPIIADNGEIIGYIGMSIDITTEKEQEQELLASKAKFKRIINNLPIVFFTISNIGDITYIEGHGLKVLGLKPEAVIGKNSLEGLKNVVLKTDQGVVISAADAIRQSLKGNTISGVIFYKGVYFSNLFFPIADQDSNEIEEVIGISINISERIKVEEALHESETRYKKLIEKAPVGIIIHSDDNKIIFANKAAANLIGISDPHKLIGEHSLKYIHPDSVKLMESRKKVLQAGGELIPVEQQLITVEGELKDVEVVGTIVELDNVVAIQSIFYDITDRKKAIQAIKSSEEKLFHITEAVPGIVIQFKVYPDMTQVCEYISKKVEQYIAVEAEEVLKDINLLFSTILEEDFEEVQRSVYKAINDKEPWFHEYRVKDKKGRVLWMSGSAEPEVNKDGTITYYGFFKEITGRKRAEQELKESNQKLQKLAQYLETVREDEKKKIAMEIHDELGQNLTSIKLDLFWLKQQVENQLPDQKAIIDKIDGAIGVTGDTINTTRRIAHELRPVILDNLGLIAALEWQVRQYEDRTGIICDLDVRSVENIDFPANMASVLFRIVQESLTNITKHARATVVKIKVDLKGEYLKMLIHDNGVGLDTSELDTSPKLGIFGIRERIKGVGGTMEINSGKSKGTSLDISIPLELVLKEDLHD